MKYWRTALKTANLPKFPAVRYVAIRMSIDGTQTGKMEDGASSKMLLYTELHTYLQLYMHSDIECKQQTIKTSNIPKVLLNYAVYCKCTD